MSGQNTVEPIMTREQAEAQAASRTFLNDAQRAVTPRGSNLPPIASRGVQGLAGIGKTTVLSSIREGAET